MPVVDASIVVDWVAPDVGESAPGTLLLDRLAASGAALLAPRLLFEEVSNALLTGIRRGRWTGAQADESHDLLAMLPVRTVDTAADRDRAWDLARRYDNHGIYDMLYVAIAERLGEQLISADVALRNRLSTLKWIIGPADFL